MHNERRGDRAHLHRHRSDDARHRADTLDDRGDPGRAFRR